MSVVCVGNMRDILWIHLFSSRKQVGDVIVSVDVEIPLIAAVQDNIIVFGDKVVKDTRRLKCDILKVI